MVNIGTLFPLLNLLGVKIIPNGDKNVLIFSGLLIGIIVITFCFFYFYKRIKKIKTIYQQKESLYGYILAHLYLIASFYIGYLIGSNFPIK